MRIVRPWSREPTVIRKHWCFLAPGLEFNMCCSAALLWPQRAMVSVQLVSTVVINVCLHWSFVTVSVCKIFLFFLKKQTKTCWLMLSTFLRICSNTQHQREKSSLQSMLPKQKNYWRSHVTCNSSQNPTPCTIKSNCNYKESYICKQCYFSMKNLLISKQKND